MGTDKKKSPQTFQCKNLLWQIFNDMSEDYGSSIDYLINVAMLEFAHGKGYVELPKRTKPKYQADADFIEEISEQSSAQSKPEPKPVPPKVKPPVTNSNNNIVQPVDEPKPRLFLIYNGQAYLVDKDQFIIGRGSSADLRIADPSISRKHALVIRKNGIFYIKDQGSINGIEYQGQRCNVKKIHHGDTYNICDFKFICKFKK